MTTTTTAYLELHATDYVHCIAALAQTHPALALALVNAKRPEPSPKPVYPKTSPGVKAAKPAEIEAAIVTILTQHGGQATKDVILPEIALLLPEAAQHPHFAQSVSWTGSYMRKQGKLHNGHDHGQYGLWVLVP
jgi:hypothetical protein